MVWYGAVHKDCIAEIERLKSILARVNALNDDPSYFRKEIDDLTIEFSSASPQVPKDG
jgi:hypothetical protein